MRDFFAIPDDMDYYDRYAEYIQKSISEERKDEIDELLKQNTDFQKQAVIPPVLTYTSAFGTLIGILILVKFFSNKNGFQDAYSRNAVLFYISIALILYGIIIYMIQKQKVKKTLALDEYKQMNEKADVLYKQVLEELGVPEEAIKIDFLMSTIYKKNEQLAKEGKKAKTIAKPLYYNIILNSYVENGLLCLADNCSVLTLPVKAFKRIVKKEEKILESQWNKDVDIKSEEYKPYKITQNNFGAYRIRYYYSIEFVINDLEYEMKIPHYEINNIQKLLDLPIVDNLNGNENK